MGYAGDHVAQQRVALWPGCDGHWIGLTPDGDVYGEDVACRVARTGPSSAFPLPLGGAKPRARLPLYRFATALTREELDRHIREARVSDEDDPAAEPPKVVFFEGAEELLPAFLGEAVLPVAHADDAEPPAGTT